MGVGLGGDLHATRPARPSCPPGPGRWQDLFTGATSWAGAPDRHRDGRTEHTQRESIGEEKIGTPGGSYSCFLCSPWVAADPQKRNRLPETRRERRHLAGRSRGVQKPRQGPVKREIAGYRTTPPGYVIVAAIEQRWLFRSRLLPVCCPGSGSRRTPARREGPARPGDQDLRGGGGEGI